MKVSYHKETDSLYVYLRIVPTAESEEIAEDTVVHFDEYGNVTGLEIYSEASKKVDLDSFDVLGIDNYRSVKTTYPLYGWQSALQNYLSRPSRTSVENLEKYSGMIGRYHPSSTKRRVAKGLAMQVMEHSRNVNIQKVS